MTLIYLHKLIMRRIILIVEVLQVIFKNDSYYETKY